MNRRKITLNLVLTALLTAISIILTRLFAIMVGPMFRITLGTIPIVGASIFLGPFYGMIVALASDFIGGMILPTGSYLIFPLIGQIIYGILPFHVVKLIRLVPSKLKDILVFILIPLISLLPVIFVFLNKGLPSYMANSGNLTFDTTFKVITLIVYFVFNILFLLLIYLSSRYTRLKKANIKVSEIALSIFITQIVADLIYGTLWKTFYMQLSFVPVIATQLIIVFITLPLLTVFTTLLGYTYQVSIGSKKSSK